MTPCSIITRNKTYLFSCFEVMVFGQHTGVCATAHTDQRAQSRPVPGHGNLVQLENLRQCFPVSVGQSDEPCGQVQDLVKSTVLSFSLSFFFVLFLFFWLLLMFLPCFILYSLGNVQARQCLHRPIRQYTLNSLFVSAWDFYIWPRFVFFWRLVFYKLLFFWFRVKSSVFCFFFWKNC